MSSSRKSSRIHTHHHAVQFYGNDVSLVATVGGFLAEGLVIGHPAIVIATAPHCAAIAHELASRLIDVDAAIASGDLLMLDAQETLATFMVDDLPHPDRFAYHVGGTIKRTIRGRPRMIVRA